MSHSYTAGIEKMSLTQICLKLAQSTFKQASPPVWLPV
ncbi:hypothetical protein SX4_3477 [Vibrio mimicus SX-4]|nr:hypothetical protein SX4_3477 [Vibrio mimicus SX-4]